MIERHTYKNTVWLDVVNPTLEEARQIVVECKLPPSFGNDLTTMVPRSDVLAKKGAIKITLDFPIVKRTDIAHPHEVKFLATKKHLVTIRFEDIESIHRFGKEFEVSELIGSQKKSVDAPQIMLTLLQEMYRTMTVKLDYLESRMIDIEEQMFQEREKEMVFEISNVSRRLIAFRQTLYVHEDVLEELEEQIEVAFGKGLAPQVEKLQEEFSHLDRRLLALTDMLDALRGTNDSLVSTKQNEIMKTLTIMAFITFPLTLFTSLFGMNTVTTPLVGQPGDFWIIAGVMIVVSIGFFAYFKYKKWM